MWILEFKAVANWNKGKTDCELPEASNEVTPAITDGKVFEIMSELLRKTNKCIFPCRFPRIPGVPRLFLPAFSSCKIPARPSVRSIKLRMRLPLRAR